MLLWILNDNFDEDWITEKLTLRIVCLPGAAVYSRLLRSSEEDADFCLGPAASGI
jgi:hypothetical protein